MQAIKCVVVGDGWVFCFITIFVSPELNKSYFGWQLLDVFGPVCTSVDV